MEPRDSDPGEIVSWEELTYCNALILQSIVELMSEKGLFGWKEVKEHVQKVQRESTGRRSEPEVMRRPRPGDR
jgi:hypothetical protein